MLFSIERASGGCHVCPCEGAVRDGEYRDPYPHAHWQPRWVIEVLDLAALLALGERLDRDLIVSRQCEHRHGAAVAAHVIIYDGYIE